MPPSVRSRGPLVLMLTLAIAAPRTASATHFRYGHVTWVSQDENSVVFQAQAGWRLDANPCVKLSDQPTVDCGTLHAHPVTPKVGDVIADTTSDSGQARGLLFDEAEASSLPPSAHAPFYDVTSIDTAN